MKAILGFLCLVLVSFNLFANAPFMPEAESRFKVIEKNNVKGKNFSRTLHGSFDYAVHGATGSAIRLGVYLPAKAIIKSSYAYIKEVPGPAGAQIALFCEDAGNIFTAADKTGATIDTIFALNATGTASTFVAGIAAECEVKAAVTVATLTGGAIEFFLDYDVLVD